MNGIMLGLSPREARKRYESVIEFAELRGVQGPQAQELLLGHARAARVLGRDPGRRRHPADRRGARRRRRRLPAEVLRRVQRDARRGARRSCSSPTTWARCSGSATARCCSSEARRSTSGEPQEVADRYLEINFGRDPDEGVAQRRAAPGDGEARVRRGLGRERSTGSEAATCPGQRITLNARVEFMVDVEDPAAERLRPTTRSTRR